MVNNIRDKLRNDVAAMHDLDELEKEIKSLGKYISFESNRSVEKSYKPTKVGVQKFGNHVKGVVEMALKRIAAIKSNLPNASPSSGSGYTAKRVRAYENKSSSPKKHLGKLFEKTASAEPVETKQKSKKENRPKRKSTFMSNLSPNIKQKVENICSDLDPEVVENIIPTGVEKVKWSPATYVRKITTIPSKQKAKSRELVIAADLVPIQKPRGERLNSMWRKENYHKEDGIIKADQHSSI